jgi:hypothetical protein
VGRKYGAGVDPAGSGTRFTGEVLHGKAALSEDLTKWRIDGGIGISAYPATAAVRSVRPTDTSIPVILVETEPSPSWGRASSGSHEAAVSSEHPNSTILEDPAVAIEKSDHRRVLWGQPFCAGAGLLPGAERQRNTLANS